MIDFLNRNPQLLIFGKIVGVKDFESSSYYVKYQIKFGSQWLLQNGKVQGETFQSDENHFLEQKIAPFDHSFEVCLITHSVRGWPKIILEIWQEDSHSRNTLAGYGVYTFPFQAGNHKVEIGLFRPTIHDQDENLINANPELIYKDILVSSESRYGFKTKTTGTVILDFNIILKDFQYHGVQFKN